MNDVSGSSVSSGDAMSMASMFTSTLSGVMGSLQAREQSKLQAAVAKSTAASIQENIKSLNIERYLAADATRHEARDKIASSAAEMAAMGNIGSSADAGVLQAYKNLDTTLSNMKFTYDEKNRQLQQEYENAKWQEKQAKKAAKKHGLSAVLGTVGAVAGAAIGSVVPGVGTAIGVSIGASIGGSLGGAAGQTFG